MRLLQWDGSKMLWDPLQIWKTWHVWNCASCTSLLQILLVYVRHVFVFLCIASYIWCTYPKLCNEVSPLLAWRGWNPFALLCTLHFQSGTGNYKKRFLFCCYCGFYIHYLKSKSCRSSILCFNKMFLFSISCHSITSEHLVYRSLDQEDPLLLFI